MEDMSTRLIICFVLLVSVFLSFGFSGDTLRIEKLSCEYRTDPLGIDTARPRLSWVLLSDTRGQFQTAFQILVASSEERLNESDADLWNSGKIVSRQSLNVEYAGKALESRLRCFWKVRVWGKRGKASGWSKTASWEMALQREDDWSAYWIDDGKENPASDKDFYADDPAPLLENQCLCLNLVAMTRPPQSRPRLVSLAAAKKMMQASDCSP